MSSCRHNLTDGLCTDQEGKEYDNSVVTIIPLVKALLPGSLRGLQSLGPHSCGLGLLASTRTVVSLEGSNGGVD